MWVIIGILGGLGLLGAVFLFGRNKGQDAARTAQNAAREVAQAKVEVVEKIAETQVAVEVAQHAVEASKALDENEFDEAAARALVEGAK